MAGHLLQLLAPPCGGRTRDKCARGLCCGETVARGTADDPAGDGLTPDGNAAARREEVANAMADVVSDGLGPGQSGHRRPDRGTDPPFPSDQPYGLTRIRAPTVRVQSQARALTITTNVPILVPIGETMEPGKRHP